jgi:serine/threonine-protein kinase
MVVAGPRGLGPGLESPDGKWLVLDSDVCCDILGFRPEVDSIPVGLIATPAQERSPALSPDWRWLAYMSDETGRFEVHVRPFPDLQSGRWQVSTARGSSPQWSHRGDELFFIDSTLSLVAVRVTGRPAFAVLGQRRLFSAVGYPFAASGRAYAVAPDGRRFLILRTSAPSGVAPTSLVLIQGFLAELARRVP